jgi:hypothetical protein
MLERYNPIFRLVCIALGGLILWQVSRLALQKEAVARGRIETPMPRAAMTNKIKVETNAPAARTNPETVQTNTAAQTNAVPSSMNPPTNKTSAAMRPPMSAMNRRPGGPGPSSNLPADVQALIDKIKVSQLLGPDIKPPPMALLGIAGKDVFLRGPSGQTGIIREGEELGGAKLIRIGTNRVIVEHEGQQKELTIFSGFGSETLLEKKDKREPLP